MGQKHSQDDGNRKGKKEQGHGGSASKGKTLTILHFNDVYNIENSDDAPISGAARLAGMIKAQPGKPLVLFSGDAFSPSVMTTVTLGEHMPPVLNTFGIHAACIGNHDFDMGLATCQSLVRQCNFPWMMSNVRDKETGKLLGGLHETLMIKHEGVKVGLMGLVEREWLDTLPALDPDQLEFIPFLETAARLADMLRAEGADLVVALTHMRENNDRALAKEVKGIDLVLGGHDHHYVVDTISPHNTLMVKSGTDFREMTRIEVQLPSEPGGRPTMSWTKLPVTLDSPQHQPTVHAVEKYSALMGTKLDQEVGHTVCDLDARFTTIRTAESNIGNLVADILRDATGADIAIFNSGSLRSDQVHACGPLRVRDIVELMPMPDSMVLLQATGSQVLEVLENGVSQVPRLEGRFPQVSGIRFKYDSSKPAGSRIIRDSVVVAQPDTLPLGKEDGGWAPLVPEQQYRVAVKSYMAAGKDGYDVLEQCKVLVDEEDGVVMSQALRNHFRALAVLNVLDPKVEAGKAAKRWLSAVRSKSSSSSNSTAGKGNTSRPASESQGAADAAPAAKQPSIPQQACAPWLEDTSDPAVTAGRAASRTFSRAASRTASRAADASTTRVTSSVPVTDGGSGGGEGRGDEEGEGEELRQASSHMLRSMPTRSRLIARSAAWRGISMKRQISARHDQGAGLPPASEEDNDPSLTSQTGQDEQQTDDTGPCVYSLEYGRYAVKPVVEGRIVDVAAAASTQAQAAAA